MNKLGIVTKGIIKENPVLVLLLGTCPTLAVTTSAINGLGMGVSAMVVLICSNIVISILKKVIPSTVRIPCYIVVIAGFVTVVQLMLKAYLPALDASLGLFIPLIVVNCIILGRAEMFASKNSIVDSALDGLGMGIGFTLALGVMGLIREILGSGTAFGITLTANAITPMGIFMLAPGGFFIYAILIAAINWATKGRAIKKKEFGCEGCAMAATCGKDDCGEKEASA
ncbi:electron transport complex subunit E [bacterium 210820-DFI.6.37]|nr:electron transport complex subunit E [bacterium 210820-DFI.6.37]